MHLNPPTPASVEAVARGIYATRPFVMASTETSFGVQMSRSFDWDSAPAYYQDDMRQLAHAAILAYQAQVEGGDVGSMLNDIGVMMSEFVDNWPEPKRIDTALKLIAKAMRAALNPPKHSFWGAGESGCPREIKAGNGELHTLRCKNCGEDNPRDDRCRAALAQPATAAGQDGDEWRCLNCKLVVASPTEPERCRVCLLTSSYVLIDKLPPSPPNDDGLREALEMAVALIQEAKGAEGPNGGFVTNHLDAAEMWLAKIEAALERQP